jgi:hypothetical protein
MRSLVEEGFTFNLPDGNGVYTLTVTKTGTVVNGGVASHTDEPVPVIDGDIVYEGDVLSYAATIVPGAMPEGEGSYNGTFVFVTSFGATRVTTFSWMTSSVQITSDRAAAARADGVIGVTVTPQTAATSWSGAADTSWYDPADPQANYVLNSSAELAGLAALVNGNPSVSFEDVTVTLGDDVSLNGLPWVPIGTTTKPFTGTFNGEGHTVSDLSISATSGVAHALFGFIAGAEVSDLTVTGSVSATTGAVAGLVANATDSVIEDCISQVAVTGGGSSTGGIVGLATNTTVKDCLSTGIVKGTGSGVVGGIAGDVSGSVIDSVVGTGAVFSASGAAGGIAGKVTSSALGAVYTTGSVSTTTGQAGGIAGTIGGTGSLVEYSYTVAEISATGTGVAGAISGFVGSNVTYTDVLYLADSPLPANGTGDLLATPLSAEDLQAAAAEDGLLAGYFVPSLGGFNAGYPLLAWQPNGEDEPGAGDPKGLLAQALADADAARADVVTSTKDGADVDSGTWWTTSDALAAFTQAIEAARTVLGNDAATDGELIAATLALGQATVDFNNATFDGKRTERSALSDA